MKKQKSKLTFSKFYLYVSEAKMTFGLFFAYMVFMYLLLGRLAKAPVQTIDFALCLQMMILNIVIGFAQRIIVPLGNVTVVKSIVLGVFSIAVSIGTAAVCGWFRGFPLWCHLVFFGISILGSFMLILHLHLKPETETRVLNEQLRKFQGKGEAKKGKAT